MLLLNFNVFVIEVVFRNCVSYRKYLDKIKLFFSKIRTDFNFSSIHLFNKFILLKVNLNRPFLGVPYFQLQRHFHSLDPTWHGMASTNGQCDYRDWKEKLRRFKQKTLNIICNNNHPDFITLREEIFAELNSANFNVFLFFYFYQSGNQPLMLFLDKDSRYIRTIHRLYR